MSCYWTCESEENLDLKLFFPCTGRAVLGKHAGGPGFSPHTAKNILLLKNVNRS